MRRLRFLAMGSVVARPLGRTAPIRTFQATVLSSSGSRIVPGLRGPLPNMLISCRDSSFDCRSSISYCATGFLLLCAPPRGTTRRTPKKVQPFQRVPAISRAMADSER